MNVQVVCDARARGRTEIHTHIEPWRRIDFTQCGLRPLGHVHQLVSDLFRCRIKLVRVQVRDDHQVPGDVRVEIEDDKTVLGPVQHKISFIVAGVTRNQTKDATIALRIDA